jgi:hypothetical protein
MFAPNDTDVAREIASCLRDADALIARAIDLMGRCDISAETGLSAEQFATLECGYTGSDARVLIKAAAMLCAMPLTKAAFELGRISWSQVRAIVACVRWVDVAARASIDRIVHDHAARETDPDELIARIDDEVARSREDLALAREDRAIQRSFLSVQGRLDGSATIYGEADAESATMIVQALDAAADQPVDPDVEGAPSRTQQHFGALVAVCESFLNGGHAGRPRPRVLATIDVDAFAKQGRTESARLLSALAGRPTRVTPLATETMVCDATIVPVVFDGARTVAVGDAHSPVSAKLRTALIARDGGCRFPGCRAPVAWCDAHHMRARIQDGPTVIDNLLLLCRRCHRNVHRFRWRLRLKPDGSIEFRRPGRTYSSTPRAPRSCARRIGTEPAV